MIKFDKVKKKEQLINVKKQQSDESVSTALREACTLQSATKSRGHMSVCKES